MSPTPASAQEGSGPGDEPSTLVGEESARPEEGGASAGVGKRPGQSAEDTPGEAAGPRRRPRTSSKSAGGPRARPGVPRSAVRGARGANQAGGPVAIEGIASALNAIHTGPRAGAPQRRRTFAVGPDGRVQIERPRSRRRGGRRRLRRCALLHLKFTVHHLLLNRPTDTVIATPHDAGASGVRCALRGLGRGQRQGGPKAGAGARAGGEGPGGA
jgi:hypothetical protein